MLFEISSPFLIIETSNGMPTEFVISSFISPQLEIFFELISFIMSPGNNPASLAGLFSMTSPISESEFLDLDE